MNDAKSGFVGGGRPLKRPQMIQSKVDEDGYIEENEDDDNEEETFAERDDDYKGMQGQSSAVNSIEVNGPTFSLPPNEQKKMLPDSLKMLAMPLPLVAAGHSLMPDM